MDLNLPFLFSAFSHLSSELLNLFHRLVNFFLSLFLSHIHCFPRDAAVLSPDVLPLDSLQRVNISFSFPTWRSRRLKTILLWIRLYSCVFTDAVFRVFEQNLGVFSPFSRFREHLSKFSVLCAGDILVISTYARSQFVYLLSQSYFWPMSEKVLWSVETKQIANELSVKFLSDSDSMGGQVGNYRKLPWIFLFFYITYAKLLIMMTFFTTF